MMKKLRLLVCLGICLAACKALEAQPHYRGMAAVAADPEEYLTIKNWSKRCYLGVLEPENWFGDLVRAKNCNAEAMFYKDERSFQNGGALIKVFLYDKRDENTLADLEYDVNAFMRDYKKAKKQRFEVKHAEYVTFSHLVFVEGETYEYLVYMNPGREFSQGVLVSMQVQEREANKAELSVFDEIVRSVYLLPIIDESIEQYSGQFQSGH